MLSPAVALAPASFAFCCGLPGVRHKADKFLRLVDLIDAIWLSS